MILQKMKVVEFFVEQSSIDLEVKSTDGKSTLIIAVESEVSVRAPYREAVVQFACCSVPWHSSTLPSFRLIMCYIN